MLLEISKLFLAARSPVLRQMLSTDMKETRESVLRIEDAQPAVVKLMLQWCYGRLPEDFSEHANELLMLGNKYEMHGLVVSGGQIKLIISEH